MIKAAIRLFGAVVLGVGCMEASAANVSLLGLSGQKAVLMINGRDPRAFLSGQMAHDGVRVLEVGADSVVIEVEGVRRRIRLGEQVMHQHSDAQQGNREIHIEADTNGHFFVNALVNGRSMRLMVDTGATLVAIGRNDAERMGVDLSRGKMIGVQTANGAATAQVVTLERFQIEGVTLYNVEAAVMGQPMPIGLLGMSFLNRMHMTRDGRRMVLKQRF